jgi:hypothetical protein
MGDKHSLTCGDHACKLTLSGHIGGEEVSRMLRGIHWG